MSQVSEHVRVASPMLIPGVMRCVCGWGRTLSKRGGEREWGPGPGRQEPAMPA